MSNQNKLKKVVSEFVLPEGVKAPPIEPQRGIDHEILWWIKPQGSRAVDEVRIKFNPTTRTASVVSVTPIGNVSSDMLLAKIEKQGVEQFKLYRKI